MLQKNGANIYIMLEQVYGEEMMSRTWYFVWVKPFQDLQTT